MNGVHILPPRKPLPPGGFTVLELLATMSVIGVLMALLLPAVGTAREAARRVQCVSQLRQVGVALHAYHAQHEFLPAGLQPAAASLNVFAWGVSLLPFMEQDPLSRQIHRDLPLGDVAHDQVRRTSLGMLLCPSDITEATFALYFEDAPPGGPPLLAPLPTASYVGVFGTQEADDAIPPPPGDGTFIAARPLRLVDLRRGTSNTLVAGERTMSFVPSTWLGVDLRGEDAACRLVGMTGTAPNCDVCDECEFSSRHSGGANFLWGDGRVSLVADNIDVAAYRGLGRRAD